MIEDGKGDAALEIREGQSCLRIRRIAVAIGDRSTGASGQGADDAIEDADQPFDAAPVAPLPRWRGRMAIPYPLQPRPKAAPLNSLPPSTTSVSGRPNIGQSWSPSPRALSHASLGQSAWARQSATESELGFSIVRQNPRIAREKTSTTIVR